MSARAPAVDRAVLDRSLFWGLAYTGGAKWLAQIVAWTSTLMVTRLLTPADYGLVGMATVYVGLVTLVNEFGLGLAIVNHRELTDHQLAQLNGLSVLLGVVALAVSCAAARPLAAFFGAPQLSGVLVVMSLGFVLAGFQTVPAALLQRDLDFRWLALLEGSQAAMLGVVMVLLALAGFGYWTLVTGNLLGIAFATAMVLAKRPHGFAWPRPGQLRSALRFSRHILLGRLAWYTQVNTDFVIAGRVLGQTGLGLYTIAWTIASVPVEKVSAIVSRVTPAVFSAVQGDRAATRRYLLLLTEVLSIVTIPLAWGLALVADQGVALLLGDKWQAVSAPLRLLAVVASLRPLVSLLSPILNATGYARFSMYNGVIDAIVLTTAFWIGSAWGTEGIAAAWLIAYPVIVLKAYWPVFRHLELSVGAYLEVLWPAVAGSACMAAVVLTVRMSLPEGWPLAGALVVEVTGGVLAYVVVMLTWRRERVRTAARFLRAGRC